MSLCDKHWKNFFKDLGQDVVKSKDNFSVINMNYMYLCE